MSYIGVLDFIGLFQLLDDSLVLASRAKLINRKRQKTKPNT